LLFDPRNTMSLIRELSSDDYPFINARIGKALIDFEGEMDFETSFRAYQKNGVSGHLGEVPVGNYDIQQMWETGKARVDPARATTCSYDGSDCYQAKVVPVVYTISDHDGWTSGGQNITVHGHGFSSGELKAYLDDIECVITSKTDSQFSCDV
jgi:hypothetical protein